MSIENKVCELIQARKKLGLAKYGTSMERTDLSQREWVQHLQEELLDAAIYAEKLKTTSNVLSEDDIQNLLALINTCKCMGILGEGTVYLKIQEKLQDALNLG
jgi:hypothetical protein